MRCLSCNKTIRLNGQRLASSWRDFQVCPACLNYLIPSYYKNATKVRLEVRGKWELERAFTGHTRLIVIAVDVEMMAGIAKY